VLQACQMNQPRRYRDCILALADIGPAPGRVGLPSEFQSDQTQEQLKSCPLPIAHHIASVSISRKIAVSRPSPRTCPRGQDHPEGMGRGMPGLASVGRAHAAPWAPLVQAVGAVAKEPGAQRASI
jgi:hypothetical protein